MKTTDRKRLEGFEMWCYRRLLGIKWSERGTSLYVLQRLNYSNKKLLASMFKLFINFSGGGVVVAEYGGGGITGF